MSRVFKKKHGRVKTWLILRWPIVVIQTDSQDSRTHWKKRPGGRRWSASDPRHEDCQCCKTPHWSTWSKTVDKNPMSSLVTYSYGAGMCRLQPELSVKCSTFRNPGIPPKIVGTSRCPVRIIAGQIVSGCWLVLLCFSVVSVCWLVLFSGLFSKCIKAVLFWCHLHCVHSISSSWAEKSHPLSAG